METKLALALVVAMAMDSGSAPPAPAPIVPPVIDPWADCWYVNYDKTNQRWEVNQTPTGKVTERCYFTKQQADMEAARLNKAAREREIAKTSKAVADLVAKTRALGVARSSPFRPPSARAGGRHAGHNCPSCGRLVTAISGRGPGGTHSHTCPCGTTWFHH